MTNDPMEEVLLFDRQAFLFLNGLGTSSWDGFWMVITGKWNAIPIYILLLWLSVKGMGWRNTLLSLVAVAFLILVTDQLANFFKYGVQRLRPCYDEDISMAMRLVKASCGGKFGFFSAHAGNTMAVATFFTLLLRPCFKHLGLLLFPWALLVGYSRIYIGVHFPLDVFFGMGVGALMGWLFYKLTIFAYNKIGL